MSTLFTARVDRVQDLTHDVRLITLALKQPPDLPFVAGQFVSFAVPADGLPHGLTRPYSMASAPRDRRRIELLLNLVPNGPGSTWLFSQREGDEVQFRGPAGTFVLRDYPDRPLLFVATGTGIAPIRSMLLARLPGPTPVTLLWGLRSQRDLYFEDELAALAARHANFSYTITLSRPTTAATVPWTGAQGRVQPLVERFLDLRGGRVDDLAVYVCGGSAMIRSVSDLVKARGVCPIHREQYYKDAT